MLALSFVQLPTLPTSASLPSSLPSFLPSPVSPPFIGLGKNLYSVTFLPYASRDPLLSLLRTTPSPALSREPSRTVAPCARLAACLRALRLDLCLCARVCARVRVCACVRVCVCACVRVDSSPSIRPPSCSSVPSPSSSQSIRRTAPEYRPVGVGRSKHSEYFPSSLGVSGVLSRRNVSGRVVGGTAVLVRRGGGRGQAPSFSSPAHSFPRSLIMIVMIQSHPLPLVFTFL